MFVWLVASALAADDSCEQIVGEALESPENHRPYVVFTQCQKNPPDFLAHSPRTCMEFARLFSLALHYNARITARDFCSTSLAYEDSEFTVDPLLEDHEDCNKTVSVLFESAAVQGVLRAACLRARTSVVLDCDRYVTEVAESVVDGLMDGSRLCDRVLTGKETKEFDPAHFLYTCVQYARRGDPVNEVLRTCSMVANEAFCQGYTNLVSRGATTNEVKAYCQHQEVKLHASETGTKSVSSRLVPAGTGISHGTISANMFSMCEATVERVSSPGFPPQISAVVQECVLHLQKALLSEELRVLGSRVEQGCEYFANKLFHVRSARNFSPLAFCHTLTQDEQGVQPRQQTSGPLVVNEFGDGKTGTLPQETNTIVTDTNRSVTAHSFVDTTPDGQDTENQVDSEPMREKAEMPLDYTELDSSVDAFLKSHTA